jgi:DNA repair protein RadC
VASDLDLHALIVAHNPPDLEIEPLQSAEEVIKEIDDLMQVFQPPAICLNLKKQVSEIYFIT